MYDAECYVCVATCSSNMCWLVVDNVVELCTRCCVYKQLIALHVSSLTLSVC